ncbi:MAG: WD40 repeat domain-containing protein [Myxococcota bacterium]|nr:WD40 repeat domain-containing protein [Myxococcota bacterium]
MQVFSPDNKTVAEVAEGCAIAIRDRSTAQEICRFEGHTEVVVDLAFSPNGDYLASASADGTARIWKPRSRLRATQFSRDKDTRILRAHESTVLRVAFSPSSRWLVTTSSDCTARIWDARRGNLIHTLQDHQHPVIHTTFSPDGSQLVTASKTGELNVYTVTENKGTSSLSAHGIAHQHSLLHHQDAIYGLVFAPDTNYLVSLSEDSTAAVWNILDGHLIHALQHERQEAIVEASFSPDGRFLTTVTEHNTESLWDAESGVHLRTFASPGRSAPNSIRLRILEALAHEGHASDPVTPENVFVLPHEKPVTQLAFSPSGDTLATGCSDSHIQLWKTADVSHHKTLVGHAGPISCLNFSVPGNCLVSGSTIDPQNTQPHPSTAIIWNVETGETAHRCDTNKSRGTGSLSSVLGLSTSPTDPRVAFNFAEQTVVWDLQLGCPVAEFSGDLEYLCYATNGASIATAYRGGTVRIIRLSNTGEVDQGTAWHGHKGSIASADFSPDSTFLATASIDKTVRIWDVARGRPHKILEGHVAELSDVRFSPDGAYLATLDRLGYGRIWSTLSKSKLEQPIHELKVPYADSTPNPSAKLVFSPNGETLAIAGRDSAVRIWHVESGKLLQTLHGHEAPITNVVYSPNGSQLATVSKDGSARLWDIVTPDGLDQSSA